MNNEVLEYFEKINFLSNEEAEIKTEMEKATIAYKNIIDPLEIELQEINAEHNRIENKVIAVNLNKIINEVAKLWNVHANEIDIQFITDICQAYVNKPSIYMSNLVNSNFKNGQYDDAFYKYIVTLSNNNKTIKFSSPLQSKAIQADGKTFLEHANYEIIESNTDPYYDLRFDDLSVLRMYFKVKNLLNDKDEATQIIINACDENSSKSNFELID